MYITDSLGSSINKIEVEIDTILEALTEAPDDNRRWRTEINNLINMMERLNVEKFIRSLNFSVGTVSSSMLNSFTERMSDMVFIQTPEFGPKTFVLKIPENSPNFDKSESEYYPTYFEIQILTSEEDYGFPPFLLKRLHLTVGSQGKDNICSQVLEDCSVWSKIEEKKGKLTSDGRLVRLWVKRPRNMVAFVSVKLFNCNISNSPLGQQFLNDQTQDQQLTNLTLSAGVNETGIEIFDKDKFNLTNNNSLAMLHHETLDQSDYNSLDITGRRNVQALHPRLDLQFNPIMASPGYYPMRRASGELDMMQGSMLPTITRPSGPPGPPLTLHQLTDTSPFRPGTGQISTMKPGSATQLSEALSEVSDDLDIIRENLMEDNEVSIMDPDKRSTLSIDDAQKSLSSVNSEEDFSLHNETGLNKSVSFAQKCQRVTILSTPQVPVGGGRFVVADGDTKQVDGEAGVHNVRRLSQVMCVFLVNIHSLQI